MADPTAYDKAYSFAGFQANDPATPLPGAQVDSELANVETAIAELVAALKDVRRSDGALKNGVVTLESLSAGLIAGLSNLDSETAAEVDAAIDLVRSDLEADIAALDTAKADAVHAHAATEVSVSAISGLTGATVQAVLAELRALAPQTGDFKLSMSPTAPSGWVACDDGTIGSATSGATTRANADTADLYALLWNQVSDTYAPVSGGRGVSATADFAANKPIALTKVLGRTLAVAGAGSGLTSRALGLTTGAETHTLTGAESGQKAISAAPVSIIDPGHPHNYDKLVPGGGGSYATGSPFVGVNTSTITNTATTGITASFTLAASSAGSAHNNMQPTSFSVHAFLKL